MFQLGFMMILGCGADVTPAEAGKVPTALKDCSFLEACRFKRRDWASLWDGEVPMEHSRTGLADDVPWEQPATSTSQPRKLRKPGAR